MIKFPTPAEFKGYMGQDEDRLILDMIVNDCLGRLYNDLRSRFRYGHKNNLLSLVYIKGRFFGKFTATEFSEALKKRLLGWKVTLEVDFNGYYKLSIEEDSRYV